MSSKPVALGPAGAHLVGARIVEGPHGPDGSGRGALDALVERLCREARAEGFAEGERSAQETSARALDEALERFERFEEEARGALARTAAELALEVARHLVSAEVEAGRHDVERIVRETLQASGVGRAPCTVHVHPEDARCLEGVAFRAGTRIVADVGVRRGAVQVETPTGLFVRDLDAALRAIGERILASLR